MLIRHHDYCTGVHSAGQNKTAHFSGILSHSTMPQMSQVLRERAIGMLTAGMSTRAVACEVNVKFLYHFSAHINQTLSKVISFFLFDEDFIVVVVVYYYLFCFILFNHSSRIPL